MINKNANIPSGLEDENIEIYSFNNELWSLYEGNKIKFLDLPEHILDLFRDHLMLNPKAIRALASLNLINDTAILKQYVWCNWGGFDKNPDFYEGGKFGSEYWDCGQRNSCPFEGIICFGVHSGNGFLSRREIEIVKLITSGKQDKEIAVLLCISEKTLMPFRERIFQKIGFRKRTEIAVWAMKNNIV